jgi:hypothetical protein
VRDFSTVVNLTFFSFASPCVQTDNFHPARLRYDAPMGINFRCTICARADAHEHVNRLLSEKVGIEEIARRTGFSRSAIGRHKLSTKAKIHPHGFVQWKAQQIRGRKAHASARHVVSYQESPENPDRQLVTHVNDEFGKSQELELQPSDVRPDDILIEVVFDAPRPAREMPPPEVEDLSKDLPCAEAEAEAEGPDAEPAAFEPVRRALPEPLPPELPPAVADKPNRELFAMARRIRYPWQ